MFLGPDPTGSSDVIRLTVNVTAVASLGCQGCRNAAGAKTLLPLKVGHLAILLCIPLRSLLAENGTEIHLSCAWRNTLVPSL